MSGTPHQFTPPCGSSTPYQMSPENGIRKKTNRQQLPEVILPRTKTRRFSHRMLPRRILGTELPCPDQGSQTQTIHLGPYTRKYDDATYVNKSTVMIQLIESPNSSDECVICLQYLQEVQDAIELENYLQPFLNEEMTLSEFIRLFGPYTKDKGNLLCEVMNEEINMFLSTAKTIFEELISDFQDTQGNKRVEYSKLQKTNTKEYKIRTDDIHASLKLLVPDFDWIKYENNPNYLQDYFSSSVSTEESKENEKKEELYCIKALHMMTLVEEELKEVEDAGEAQRIALCDVREDSLDQQQKYAAEMNMLQGINAELRSRLMTLRNVRRDLTTEYSFLLAKSLFVASGRIFMESELIWDDNDLI